MTRSWAFMSQGDVVSALQINPFGSLLFVWLVVSLIYLTLRRVTPLPALRLQMTRAERWGFWTTLIALLLLNWSYTWTSGVATLF